MNETFVTQIGRPIDRLVAWLGVRRLDAFRIKIRIKIQIKIATRVRKMSSCRERICLKYRLSGVNNIAKIKYSVPSRKDIPHC